LGIRDAAVDLVNSRAVILSFGLRDGFIPI
jgi:hypothetical protein